MVKYIEGILGRLYTCLAPLSDVCTSVHILSETITGLCGVSRASELHLSTNKKIVVHSGHLFDSLCPRFGESKRCKP